MLSKSWTDLMRLPLRHFLNPRMADSDGLVAVTHAITTDLLLEAYQNGIFPWSDRPAGWYSPDPRSIFELDTLTFSRRLRRVVRQGKYRVTFDRAFQAVMESCGYHHEQSWLSPSMVNAYTEFHRMGYAHSVEIWGEKYLVGGLYGVQVGKFFAGESMFFHETDASKVGFFHLVEKLRSLGVVLFDSQVINPHTASLGAIEIPRADYLARLEIAIGDGAPSIPW